MALIPSPPPPSVYPSSCLDFLLIGERRGPWNDAKISRAVNPEFFLINFSPRISRSQNVLFAWDMELMDSFSFLFLVMVFILRANIFGKKFLIN